MSVDQEKFVSESAEGTIEFEIEDTPEVVEEEAVDIDFSDATKEEQDLATSHGITNKEKIDGEHEEQPKVSKEDNSNKEEEGEVEEPTFEQVEENEKLVDKYNKNEKALYWKWKSDKVKRQEAQKERDEIVDKYGLDRVKALAYDSKMEKLNKLLESDSLTVEDIKSILNEEVKASTEEVPANVDVIKQKVAQKAQFAEKIGESKYDNFKAIANLAKEVIQNDKSGTYQSLIDQSFINDNVDENTLVERIVSIAKMSDKYNDISKSVKAEDKVNVNKALANSKKKISSAALPSSGGRRVVSHEDLTVEDAAKLSNEDWGKLPQKTKKRILMGINP